MFTQMSTSLAEINSKSRRKTSVSKKSHIIDSFSGFTHNAPITSADLITRMRSSENKNVRNSLNKIVVNKSVDRQI